VTNLENVPHFGKKKPDSAALAAGVTFRVAISLTVRTTHRRSVMTQDPCGKGTREKRGSERRIVRNAVTDLTTRRVIDIRTVSLRSSCLYQQLCGWRHH
jgi:hypothetical protein